MWPDLVWPDLGRPGKLSSAEVGASRVWEQIVYNSQAAILRQVIWGVKRTAWADN
jgi:hypothetical protein